MNGYKLLVIKCFFFLSLLILVDLIIGFAFTRMENIALAKSPTSLPADYAIKSVQSDVVIIGASEAVHSYIPQIIEDSLNCSVYNCGNDGKPALYQIAVTNCILDRYVPELIIWSVSPMWLSDKNVNEDINRLSDLNPFYKDYPYCRDVIVKKSWYESIKCLSNAYLYNSTFYNYLSCIISPDKNVKYGRYKPLYGTDKDIQMQERDLTTSFSYSDSIAVEFDQVLNRCNELGSRVVLIFTPRFEKSDYNQLFSYKKLIELANNNQAIVIEDFYRNSELLKPQYFKDFAHLNDDGARFFSSLLAHRVKSICE